MFHLVVFRATYRSAGLSSCSIWGVMRLFINQCILMLRWKEKIWWKVQTPPCIFLHNIHGGSFKRIKEWERWDQVVAVSNPIPASLDSQIEGSLCVIRTQKIRAHYRLWQYQRKSVWFECQNLDGRLYEIYVYFASWQRKTSGGEIRKREDISTTF